MKGSLGSWRSQLLSLHALSRLRQQLQSFQAALVVAAVPLVAAVVVAVGRSSVQTQSLAIDCRSLLAMAHWAKCQIVRVGRPLMTLCLFQPLTACANKTASLIA